MQKGYTFLTCDQRRSILQYRRAYWSVTAYCVGLYGNFVSGSRQEILQHRLTCIPAGNVEYTGIDLGRRPIMNLL